MLLTIRSSETVLHKLTTVFWYIHDEFFCRRSPNINHICVPTTRGDNS
ncbi:hypothetical protein HanHA300_Chr10g0360221 [Helianthus annuus]|nr:hypothetical protein HanHA300_Chr10g0360221 [Helianthus annuus]KAJ0521528.1 hypothetical protein HanIR_Chr10g0471971 [Helianthus annuus]KAJ0529756.1 hypothetical protein HanHA89_Chr10g0381681 [Helianthus annuus]KAJ0696627.1 hypothetical protein HanLR1_Chr10g0359401 [Helianthus annuus]